MNENSFLLLFARFNISQAEKRCHEINDHDVELTEKMTRLLSDLLRKVRGEQVHGIDDIDSLMGTVDSETQLLIEQNNSQVNQITTLKNENFKL